MRRCSIQRILWQTLLGTMVVVLAGTALVSCRGGEPEYPTLIEETCLMTYLGDVSGGMLFEMQRSESDEPVRMKAPVRFVNEMEKGRRLLISYSANVADTMLRPVPIELVEARMVPWGVIEPKPLPEILAMNPGQVSVVSSWQTRGHLNMQLLVDFDGAPRGFAIYADEATLGSGIVDCYIVNEGNPVENLVERRSVASFSTELFPSGETKVRLLVHSKKND